MKRRIGFWIDANLSREQYEKAKDDMYKNNVMMLRVLSSVAATLFFVSTILGLFVPNMHSKISMYLVGLVCSALVLLAALFTKSKGILSFCMYFFDILLLAVGLLITLVSAQEQLTVTLIPIVILLPLFFDTKPYKFSLVVLLADLTYLIIAPAVKPAEILMLDMVDVLVFSIAGILIGTVITKVKIERYVYAQEISRIAIYDALTECYNRTAYKEFLKTNKELSDSFTVIMVDINGLKRTNDSLGHEAGDELIITVAKSMRTIFDSCGRCFRIGGDEFVAFIDADDEKAFSLTNAFRKLLWEFEGRFVRNITVSVGCATAGVDAARPLEALVNLADSRMYEDKQAYYERTNSGR